VDLPEDVTVPSPHGPLEGTPTRRPRPPLGARQRRLTFTADRRYPGLQGPRHWLRSAPDGSKIAFLMRDDAGTAQLWTVSPNGGLPRQVTQDAFGVASAFTWSPDGHRIAYAADNSIFTVEVETGRSMRLTPRTGDADAPLPLACVFSPDGRLIAYQRRVPENAVPGASRSNQVFVVPVSAREAG
jgi:Tol biopolymer transport system component